VRKGCGNIAVFMTLFSCCALLPNDVLAQDELLLATSGGQAGNDLALLFSEEELFISASQSTQTLGKAPAIATVISDKQLREMGARNIFDALVTIPGFGYSYLNNISTESDIEVRGIKSRMEKVLLMIDGHRVNSPFFGSFNHLYDEFPIEQIKRIEVIRGPGSALYGANAFVGVINIIMKKIGDVEGVTLKGGGGNNQRSHANLLGALGDNGAGMVLSYDRLDTNGSRRFVPADAAGARGYTNFWRTTDTAYLNGEYGKFSFSGLYLDKQRGTPLAITNFIDPGTTRTHNKQAYGSLTYKDRIGGVDVETNIALDQFWWDANWYIGFPGFTTGHPLLKNQTWSGEVKARFSPFEHHDMTVGVVQDFQRQYDVVHTVNGVDVTSAFNHNQSAKRKVFATYLQDEWTAFNALSVTAGIRYDHYNDLGNTLNPRFAVVWTASDMVDIKLLFGSAFRAPSFLEMYEINNPSAVGNPNLKPEKMQTIEAGITWKINPNYQLSSNLFHNLFRDQIVQGSPLSINKSGATIWGVETELKSDWREHLYGYLNYAWYHSRDKLTQSVLPDVPRQRFKAGINAGCFDDLININTGLRWDGQRPRAVGDTRAPAASTTLVDFTVSSTKLVRNLELSLKAHNLFDANVSDPTVVAAGIPAGYPRPGRTIMAEASYSLK